MGVIQLKSLCIMVNTVKGLHALAEGVFDSK